jgi:hypothetical protein
MTHTFTTLRHALEKLQEAEYFLAGVTSANGLEFQFNLNAFLSACRSVTFLMQKSMAHVPGFAAWYRGRQEQMKLDAAMSFFVELRNISQKEGPVSYVGGSMLSSGLWSHRFAGNREAVPPDLLGMEVAHACAVHLVKLARLAAACVDEFPFETCPATAISEEGMTALQYSLADVAEALGLPADYLDVGDDIPMAEKLRYLQGEFEPLDREELDRIRSGDFQRAGRKIDIPIATGSDLTDTMVSLIESYNGDTMQPRNVFLAAVMKHIGKTDKN